jgi:hypothetical protein
MPRVGLEPAIPAFERAKPVHTSDRAAGHCDQPLKFLATLIPLIEIKDVWQKKKSRIITSAYTPHPLPKGPLASVSIRRNESSILS